MVGELPLLSLSVCYCNDIYREAAKRNIKVSEISVEFFGECGGEKQGLIYYKEDLSIIFLWLPLQLPMKTHYLPGHNRS